MTLPDGLRHGIATAAAAVAFLAMYFGAGLVWWLALALGIGVYFGLLLIVGRRKPAEEIMVSDRVSAADLRDAVARLDDAARRLRKASGAVPPADRDDLAAMADRVQSIRDQISEDPKDYRHARRFVGFYLPKIVETVESYAELSAQSRGRQADRLGELGSRIRRFRPVVERIDQACLENDFVELEVQVEVLATQVGS